jgi:hypothetical protein
VSAPLFCQGALSIGDSSSHVGPLFENEARDVLNALRSSIFPWATTVTQFESRDDFSDDSEHRPRQFDLFAYSDGDSAGPCVGDPGRGVAVVLPTGQVARVPAQAKSPPPETESAAAASAAPSSASSEETSPMDESPDRKCVVGEVYGGWRKDSEEAKCHQLESELVVLLKRFRDRNQSAGENDITQIVGAAVLVFAAEVSGSAKRRRSSQLASAVALVRACAGPFMQRLMQAGRLVVVVLSPQQVPQSAAERDSFSILREVVKSVARIEARLDAQILATKPTSRLPPYSSPATAIAKDEPRSLVTGTVALSPGGKTLLSRTLAVGLQPAPCRNLRCPRRNLAARHCSKGYCAICCAGSSGSCVFHSK